ncbi:TIGR04002 family protein [Cellulosilyticum sp. WCF-2]|uniref:TIGR04002 family protein n=1 Tax=Cellulosilyticum sp. WCF-2 TaxID=2497860 RepID=UPI000F8F3903|nr:TIGR04002 family protein [Cellulosilyticum sp. WCF-2]QEH67055.1 TIGR04002 family protein [Cellulosilyticum sp. WCF-2]
MNQSEKTRTLVMTALFAAIIFVVTRINIPTGIGAHVIHVGDSMIYLAACILPVPYAMAAGAIGAALSDAITPGGMVWVIPTMLIKPLLVIYFTSGKGKFICVRNVAAVVLAGLTGVFGYFLADAIMTGNFMAGLAAVLPGLLQPLGSAIVFLAMGYAFDMMGVKNKLKRQLRGNV